VPIVDSVGAAVRDRDRYSCVKRENGDQERTLLPSFKMASPTRAEIDCRI